MWAYIIDPVQVVVCLPGAHLDEVIDDKTYAGSVKVKVGPLTVVYTGRISLTERDETLFRLKMVGKGTEKGGSGSAKMELSGAVHDRGEDSEVVVDAELELAGKIVRFGRGMIESVSEQLFRQFADALRENLEREQLEAPSEEDVAASSPDSQEVGGDESMADAPEPVAASHRVPESFDDRRGPKSSRQALKRRETDAVSALPLLLRALWTTLKRFFLKLFGGSG